MRRGLVCLVLAAVLMVGTACGAKQADAAQDQQTLTGTLDEVKSFMFVVTDDQNSAYVFPTEEGDTPPGLADFMYISPVSPLAVLMNSRRPRLPACFTL